MKKLILTTTLCLILSIFSFADQNNVDSLLTELKTAKPDTNKVNILNKLAGELSYTSPDSSIDYSKKALKLAEKLKLSPDEAIAKAGKKAIANSYNNIGSVHYYQGNYSKALEYYQKDLKICEELGDKRGMGMSYNNIGIVHSDQGNYSNGLEYYQKCLKICEELGHKKGMGMSYNNIGIVHDEQGNYSKALEYYQKHLKICEEFGDKQGIATSFGNISELNIKLEQYNDAIEYANKSLKISEQIGALYIEKYAYETLSKAYDCLRNYKKAYEYHKLYKTANDSLFNEKKNKQITEMEVKYETEKKDKEIKLLNKDKAIKEAEIKKQTLLRNSFIVGFILFIIISLLIYNRYEIKKKANKILNGKNKQITKQKNQLSQTLDKLRETQKMLVDTAHRAGMAEIASGILHNVGNVLNSVKVSSQILKERIKKSKVNGLEKALNLMEEHTNELGNYITSDEKGKMPPTYLIKVGKILKEEQENYLKEISNLHKGIDHIEEIVAVQQNYAGVSGIIESVSLSKMMDDVLRMYQDSFGEYKIKVVKYYKESTPISIEKGKLMQVFVNLFKNAQESLILTESENKAITIIISENKENKSQMVEITDNGIGIKKDNLERIFSYGFTTKKNSQGLGLHTSALAMAELKGKLLAYSDGEGMGAKFSVIVPKNR